MSTVALTRLGPIVVGIEGHRVTAFFDAGERDPDCDLARLLDVPAPLARPRLLEIAHASGTFILAIHGRVRLAASDGHRACDPPALVVGVFRRACLRGVTWHDNELVYMIDVERVAERLRAREENTP